MLLLSLLLWGLLSGWLANLILGGSSRPESWGRLLGAGLAGSFVGGLLISFISGDGIELQASGLIGSVVGAVIVLAVVGLLDRK